MKNFKTKNNEATIKCKGLEEWILSLPDNCELQKTRGSFLFCKKTNEIYVFGEIEEADEQTRELTSSEALLFYKGYKAQECLDKYKEEK